MNADRKKFWLGLFALATLGMLAILITFFGGFLDLFISQYRYVVKFPQAPGVEPGALVRKSGVRIGEVTAVTLNPDSGEVLLDISVASKYQLRKSDRPLLGKGLLLTEPVINFVPEGPQAEPAPEGYVFQGQVGEDLVQALGRAGELVPATEKTLEELRTAAKSFNQYMPELRRLNGEAEVAMHNFSKASESVDNLVRGNQDRISKAIEQITETTRQLSLLMTEENQRQINATIKNVRQASDTLANVLTEENKKNLNETVKNARTISGQMANALSDENTRNFSDLLKNLRAATDGLDQTMKKVDQLAADGRAGARRFSDAMANADQVMADFRQVSKPLAERGPRILKNVDEGSSQFTAVLYQTGDMLRFLAETDGTFHRLVADPKLYNNINDGAAAFAKSAARLERIMADVALFADKIARHPELLGLSGAVQPSSGVKH